ncbi:MAG: glycosyltransferase, partial [Terrimicrobiaceae bacterium]|nr:glycosyltransferase [Terrimicrobiaceae bacterium]
MRVAFASLGSLGDLHPLLSVARAAEKRGHDVVIAASKGFRDYVTSLDLKFFPIRPDLEPAVSQVRRLSDPGRGPERLLREEVFPRCARPMRILRRHVGKRIFWSSENCSMWLR